MKWSPSECKAGDMIRIPIGAFYHIGIFVSENEVIQFGLPPVPENRTDNSNIEVLATDIDTFSCGRIVEVAKLDFKEKLKRFKPQKTVEIARSRIGERGYNIIHNNCEHFAYECVFGVKYCSQEDELRKKWRNRQT